MLTEDHKSQRIVTSREFLNRYADEGEAFLDSIVTGDETWVYHFTPESKQQSLEWRHSRSSKKKKVQSDPVSAQSHGHCVLGPERSASHLIHAFWDHH